MIFKKKKQFFLAISFIFTIFPQALCAEDILEHGTSPQFATKPAEHRDNPLVSGAKAVASFLAAHPGLILAGTAAAMIAMSSALHPPHMHDVSEDELLETMLCPGLKISPMHLSKVRIFFNSFLERIESTHRSMGAILDEICFVWGRYVPCELEQRNYTFCADAVPPPAGHY